MFDLLLRLGISVCLAYCSQRGIAKIRVVQKYFIDVPFLIMVIMLSLFCGLRTDFNDTRTYVNAFLNAPTMEEFFSEGISLLENPLFYGYRNFFRHHISPNFHLYLLSIAFFSIYCMTSFIRKFSTDFAFSMVLFFAIGQYVSNFAAMKQCTAIAVLLLAIPALLEKRYIRFYVLVFIAMLIHTYALLFCILPLFIGRPWTKTTYFAIFTVIYLLFTFETSITLFMEYAEAAGKEIEDSAVFDDVGINLLRLAVFSIPPLLSWGFNKYISYEKFRSNKLLVNMSILSFLVMSLGLFSAANLFGRSAIYFEMGTIVALPWLIESIFRPNSAKVIKWMASICYLVFFLYDIQAFSAEYRGASLAEFIATLF